MQNPIASLYFSAACKFDFEGGINDWDKTGTAFNNQPTYDDNPTARNRGQPANQQGDWWIGGAEDRPYKSSPAGRIQGDGPLGTLTSPYFTITGPFISFLIGGGCDINTVRAELIIDNKVYIMFLFQISVYNRIFFLLYFTTETPSSLNRADHLVQSRAGSIFKTIKCFCRGTISC